MPHWVFSTLGAIGLAWSLWLPLHWRLDPGGYWPRRSLRRGRRLEGRA